MLYLTIVKPLIRQLSYLGGLILYILITYTNRKSCLRIRVCLQCWFAPKIRKSGLQWAGLVGWQANFLVIQAAWLTFSGWWYTCPSEKYEFVSWDDYSQLNRKIKFMFQTTNQFFWWLSVQPPMFIHVHPCPTLLHQSLRWDCVF